MTLTHNCPTWPCPHCGTVEPQWDKIFDQWGVELKVRLASIDARLKEQQERDK